MLSHMPQIDFSGRVWAGHWLQIMQRTQGGPSSGQCKLEGRPGCQALGGGAWEPW